MVRPPSIYLAILLFTLSSCDFTPVEISPDVEVEKNNVLAMVFLTPDLENHWGFVRHSPSFQESTPRDYAIRDARIAVWEDGHANEKSVYTADDNFYTLSSNNFIAEAGSTYRIEIKANDRTLSGTATIPEKVTDIRVDDIRRGVSIFGDNENEDLWELDVSWQDTPNEENYYIVEVWGGFRQKVGTGYEVTIGPTSLEVNFEDIARDDQGEDGQRLTITVSTDNAGTELDVRRWNFVDLFLITCDRVYARYHYLTQVGGLDSNDPFTQALTLELNLEGGLGAFAGYRVHRKRLDITRLVEDLPSD